MTRKLIYFGQFCVDSINETLTRQGDAVQLTPKAFSLLQYLIDHAGQLASKDAIFDHVWTDRVVTDAALTVCVRELRAALTDNARAPKYIETVSKRGYRFIAEIRNVPDEETDFASASQQIGLELPFVGRVGELSELNRCEMLAGDGSRQVVFVTGEPGIGKTTFIEAFLREHIDTDSTWIARGQCIEQYGAGEAYMPVLDSMGNLSRLGGESLVSILEKHAPTLLAQLPALSSERTSRLSAQNVRPERLLREITDAIEVIANQHKLIVVLEDLHWSDLPTLELLSFLARRDNRARLLVIASFRPADAIMSNHPVKKITDQLQRLHCCTCIQLECLSEKQVDSYVKALYPAQNFPAEFTEIVRQKSEGNPLFMVNLLNYMQRVELLRQENDRWNLTSGIAEINLCTSDDIHVIVNQQIEQLNSGFQLILEAASVASEPGGQASEFTLGEVAAVLQSPDLEIENDLDWLARNNIFIRTLGIAEWPDGTLSNSYGFTHALYQNVLYDRISALHKVQNHRLISKRLEAGYASRQDEIAGQLAVHYELGREHSQAVIYLTRMAEVASSRGANREALLALKKATDLLSTIGPSEAKDRLEISVLLLQASAITASQGNATPALEACYQRALHLCEKVGDQYARFRSMFGLRSFYIISGELDKAYELALTLLSVATMLGDKALILEAHVGLANSEFFIGNHEACHAHVLEGIALYDRTEHGGHALMYGLDPGVFCYARAAQTAWLLGLADQSIVFVCQAVELAEMQQHPYSLVLAIHVKTQIHLILGHADEALESAQRGKQLALEHEFSFMHAWALCFSSWALALVGNHQAALDEIELARNAPRPLSKLADSYLLAFMAEAYLEMGLAEQGLECLSSPTLGQSYDAERGYLKTALTALLATDRTTMQDTIRIGRETLALCRRQSARSYELKTSIVLAEIYSRQGKNRQALACLKEIVPNFEEGHETLDILKAKKLITNLEQIQQTQVLT